MNAHQSKVADHVVVLDDVTRRRNMEEELKQLRRTNASALATLGLLHDFNNIVTVLLCTSGLLVTLDEHSREGSLASDIRDGAKRAAAISRQILNLARGGAASASTVNLNATIATLRGLLARMLGDDVEVHVVLDEELGDTRIDSEQLEYAILNIVSNARDAMPRGGRLTLKTENTEVVGGVDRGSTQEIAEGSYVTLTVSDTGVGMTEPIRDRAFEPFFTTKAREAGVGLGLSMVRRLVIERGGHLTVETAPGQGTTMRIHLPRVERKGSVTRGRERDAAVAGGSETVLLVERDANVRRVARDVLEQKGYRISEAGTASQAIARVERQGAVDLLVAEASLPVLSGAELARVMGGARALGVVLLTNAGRVEGSDSEVEHVRLEKPFSPSQLASAVRTAGDRRERLQGPNL